MSRPGTKGVPRERREEQILDIATATFGDRGYANASIVEIAAAVGVSKPLIYAYFGSRDGLHAACVHRAGRRLVDAVAAAQAAHGAHDRALATLTGIFGALDGHTQNWKIIYDATLPRPGTAFTVARDYQDALNAMGAEGVAAVLADAGIAAADDHSLLLAVWYSIVSTTISWWGEHPDQTSQDMTDRCLRLFTAFRRPT
ncbi:TetR/AcrR family transcriptional regulator [Nocardia uniformis]|uniref:TetR/AcrR family transcriptional regulator n=1 Tax=Nocardia uniformis TaxID=53432 RepID=A0A849C819_9NOCA|nr:TetR/AcrR family transcriptional regulator [Nocardia uniformis]NNH72445.1 TetR/AcrR family transcriptional regulator [Nocardia uniformis]